ncbi:UbiA-like polyprenyltransferase [Thermoflavimicrobium dichotomicum]|uniref:4-hydroxybenzoate polyprenyltransferase n=1 Tax=Thermoflavimicrobium dichotomicum TaxID=46223 RepID=A0A1I3SJP2_9BACL|nr:UbiA-like polyprenyltransferase [Thermoflavimicrobium dichotomicum]SFJ57949.1 4-hydroxybenzoate polyprenyltransferase [Thermoflavimicrobium dichotomicum]
MSFLRRIQMVLDMIKFEHTIFALPFAYLGAVLGSLEVKGHLPTWAQIGWITLAMVGARSAAMALNRIIDRQIDAKNPRTANRHIPAGLISVTFAWGFVLISFIVLFYAAAQLNMLAVQLLPIAVFFLVFYSYTKRFTWTCHFVLGITTALGPLGGWVATTGQIDGMALILFATVALWIGGFDVIYACQDVEFDRKEGLFSIPARFGIKRALAISSWMHAGTAIGLIALLFLTKLQFWYGMGVLIALAILVYEHMIVSADDLSRLNTAFFTMNGILSVIVFVFTMVDVLL